MKNQFEFTQFKSRRNNKMMSTKVMMMGFVVMLALLFGSLGAASAMRMDGPTGPGNGYVCTSEPICGYLNAHRIVSQETSGLGCDGQPICGYLRAHESVIQERVSLVCTDQPICGYLNAHLRIDSFALQMAQEENGNLAFQVIPETGK